MNTTMIDEGPVLQAWSAKQLFLRDALKVLQEYIDEAEHQDGWEYWLSIREEGNFLQDFGRYITARQANYPEGKKYPDDQGEITIRMAADLVAEVVRIDFGKPVNWLAFEPPFAKQLAAQIISKADEIENH